MELLSRIQDNPIVLLIPFISGLVGWFTNVVAIKMMFHPVEFVGIPPYLGWQGVVPANAMRLARVSNALITQKLLSLRQLFDASFSAEEFSGKLGSVIDQLTDQVIDEVANKHAKPAWDNAGQFMQAKVRGIVREEIARVASEIASDMADDIDNILDIEKTILEAMERYKGLMGEMFYEVGRKELWRWFLFRRRFRFRLGSGRLGSSGISGCGLGLLGAGLVVAFSRRLGFRTESLGVDLLFVPVVEEIV